MLWQTISTDVSVGEYASWHITRKLLYEHKGRPYYEYNATKYPAVIVSCSWYYIREKLKSSQLTLF